MPLGPGPAQAVIVAVFRVSTPGARLTVRQSRSDGNPIVLLHGGPGVPDSMQTTVAPLLPGFRCISFDQRGVGTSECSDGRYTMAAYVDDIEAIRSHLGLEHWHVLGHSWGGLLAQAYTARCPDRVDSLVLSSASLGTGALWKRTKREAFLTDRRRAGLWGTARFLAFGSLLYLPGPTRSWAMRAVMTETWHNYFLDPKTAPDPNEAWLAGCSAKAMFATDRTLAREPVALLDGVTNYHGPVMVLYGEHDIFGAASTIVRDRFPQARQITLPNSGHLHWLENPQGYGDELRAFLPPPGPTSARASQR